MKAPVKLDAHLASRARGAVLRRSIEQSSEPTILDFSQVVTLSDSFADELLGVLLAQKGPEWFRNYVQIQGLAAPLRASLLAVLERRMPPVAA